ncbi:MAG: hypothetical protein HY903_21680, partial [Deltaproteobacteria bacterium]|nr:hypothetical protein [Deltaproteobacteria bacterium]
RRYDAEPVLDDDALVGRLRYILAHGVKEGLVARPEDWPGLTSIYEISAGDSRAFAWPGGDIDGHATTKRVLRVAPLPCWAGDDEDSRKARVLALMRDIEAAACEERGGRPVLGARDVAAQDPHSKPASPKRSRRPQCHASTQAARDEYRAKYTAFADAYVEASAAYRSGRLDVEFPACAHRPPWVVPHRLAA